MTDKERLGFTVEIPLAVAEEAARLGVPIEVLVRRWETGDVQADTRLPRVGYTVWAPVPKAGEEVLV